MARTSNCLPSCSKIGYATGLIGAGCDVVTMQRALGHAKATTILNTYAHPWPTAEDRTRKAASGLFATATATSATAPSRPGSMAQAVTCGYRSDSDVETSGQREIAQGSDLREFAEKGFWPAVIHISLVSAVDPSLPPVADLSRPTDGPGFVNDGFVGSAGHRYGSAVEDPLRVAN